MVYRAAAVALVVATSLGLTPFALAAPQQGVVRSPAQGPPRDGAQQPKTGTAVIRGRVTALDTGRPLRRVQVRLSAPETQENRTGSTGSNGRFEFRDLPAGSYTIALSRGGYLRLSYGQTRPGDPPGRLDLAEGQVVSDLEFVLPRTSVISGRVFDEVGEPIAGVTVTALQSRFYEGARKLVPLGSIALSDDTGTYRLLGLEPGDYYLMATARDTWESDGTPKETLAFVPTYYPSAPSSGAGQRVKVTAGQEASATDISLIPGRVVRVSGTAFSSQGAPLAGQTVGLTQSFRSPSGFMSMWSVESAKIGPDGTFLLKSVPPGEYTLTVRLPASGDAPPENATATVSVGSTDIEGVTLTTSAGGQLNGRIVFDGGAAPPLPPARLRVLARPVVRDISGGLGSQDNGRVRDDWTFTLTGIVGANRISVATLPPGWAIKSIDQSGREVADALVDFTSGEKHDDVRITVTDRFPTLAGTTRDERGAPVEAMVLLFAADPAKWGEESRMVRTVRSERDGTFRLRAVPPGDYLAVALAYVVDGDWNDPEFLERLRERAARVTLADGEAAPLTLRVSGSS